MDLSKNFTTQEAIRSSKAIEKGIDNSMPKNIEQDADWFADTVLQPIRTKIGIPFDITSWYRCPKLNKAVGGVSNSAHLSGTAIDVGVRGKSTKESFNLILAALKDLKISFDQLIAEKNTKTGVTWVHLASKRKGNRNHSFYLNI